MIKNKEKGFDGTTIHISLTILHINNIKGLFKPFGYVQSRVGGTGIHTSLMSWRSDDLVGSSFFTEIPHPAHVINTK